MYGFGGGMGGFGGGGPQFQNAVGQHLGNMMGGGYAPGGMPQQRIGQGVSNQFDQYGNMGQQISGRLPGYGSMGQQISGQMPFGGGIGGNPSFGGGMPNFGGGGFYQPENQPEMTAMPRPGYGFNPQPDGVQAAVMPISGPSYLLPFPGYGYSPRPMPQPTYRPGGFPQPDGRGAMNPGFGGRPMPQPDGGPMRNPDMQREYANGDQYYNAKGNLRMRYRDGGQMAGQAPPRPY